MKGGTHYETGSPFPFGSFWQKEQKRFAIIQMSFRIQMFNEPPCAAHMGVLFGEIILENEFLSIILHLLRGNVKEKNAGAAETQGLIKAAQERLKWGIGEHLHTKRHSAIGKTLLFFLPKRTKREGGTRFVMGSPFQPPPQATQGEEFPLRIPFGTALKRAVARLSSLRAGNGKILLEKSDCMAK